MPSRGPTLRRVNLIATLTVAACAAGAAYTLAFGPEGDHATASPLAQVTSDAPTAASQEVSPEAPVSPDPTSPPAPAEAYPASGASPSTGPSPSPSGAPAGPTPGGWPSPSAAADVESPTAATDVELSYLAWNPESRAVEASGYAAVYEDGGTCRLVLTKAGTSVSAESAALPDVQTTSCGGLSVPGNDVSSGTWLAVLEYTSPTSAGSSAPREVIVP